MKRQWVAMLALGAGSFFFQTSPLLGDELLLEDHFDRQETDESKEQLGGQWGTNSRTRAAGNKQVDLADGALHIYRHRVADHGVSVVHDLAFKNATIEMRFKIDKGDELGINIADMNEKSVHAGHLCVAKIRLNKLTLMDLKTGRMSLPMREKSQAKKLTQADRKLLETKQAEFPIKLSADAWHTLKVVIEGDTMVVDIDGREAGRFSSPGIDHATKSRLRLAVAKEAWVDDITVRRQG